MKYARFFVNGRSIIAVDNGQGFIDYGFILETRGFYANISGIDPEKRMLKLISRGMLDEKFVIENFNWAHKYGKIKYLPLKDEVPLLPFKPGKVIGIARNWKEHATELGNTLPDFPVYFCKAENTVIGPEMPIKLPVELGRIDYEGELGVVLSKRASRVNRAEVSDFILGYTIVNDVTAREFNKRQQISGYPWFQGKSIDSFCPIGPWIVSPSSIEPIDNKNIKVMLNGEIKTSNLLGEMHWKMPELIETITRFITLQPGDIVALGTPPGTGPLNHGDRVEVFIEAIGTLSNPCEELL